MILRKGGGGRVPEFAEAPKSNMLLYRIESLLFRSKGMAAWTETFSQISAYIVASHRECKCKQTENT